MKIKVTPIKPDLEVIRYILSEQIKADSCGILRMLPKSQIICLFIEGLTSYEVNILKQESLSVGADLAISRQSILKNRKNEKALLLATRKHLKILKAKLKDQNISGFKELVASLELDDGFGERLWHVRSRAIKLTKPVIMGIINITPDSFSGDGINSVDAALKKAEEMLSGGAIILDLGAESSRPGSKRITDKEELNRLLPIFKAVRKKFQKAILSVDTYKTSVAKILCEEGVDVINDITGLRSPEMRNIVLNYKVGAVIMHMKGTPTFMQRHPVSSDVITVVYEYLKRRVKRAILDGIKEDYLVIDPGIGFGKEWVDNYSLIAFTSWFASIRPVLIGASRKSFIGFLTGADVKHRLAGTISANLYAYDKGASIFRVHDVKEIYQAFQVWEKLREISS